MSSRWGVLRAILDLNTRLFLSALVGLDEEHAGRPSPQAFPIEDPTLVGGVAFLLEHESHHIGQLAYLRRYFGLPAMRWGGTSA